MGRPLPLFMCFALLSLTSSSKGDGWDPRSSASNQHSILNTRHNLTMSYTSFAPIMSSFRNNYFEVCVYCHTPHGANRKVDAPLWNRSLQLNYTNYTTYNQPLASDQQATQPGPNSLTCLTCHDGAVSVDSIINMPTRRSGNFAGYNQNMEQVPLGPEAAHNSTFLDSWSGPGQAPAHSAISAQIGSLTCMTCHNGVFIDFTVFQIAEDGTNLANDHPVGIAYPDYDNSDYRQPTGISVDAAGRPIAYFDDSKSGKANHLDKEEIRLYNSGDGPEVECASCHDPHGVPSDGAGSEFIPSFLRVNNKGSQLCLTCHIK